MRALADPTRVQMLHMLKAAAEPICVCDFTAAFDLGQPTVSHHSAKLREAGLVESRRSDYGPSTACVETSAPQPGAPSSSSPSPRAGFASTLRK